MAFLWGGSVAGSNGGPTQAQSEPQIGKALGALLAPAASLYAAFVCQLCEGDVADRNAKHNLLAFGVGELICQCTSFFCPSPPPFRIVDALWHKNSPS